ncbi:hypothetical protein ACFY9A_39425 [Streptomyces rubradiris]|uniref:hypothetical protein n=1 Tax=Streptomyces rubradiris TaxID=285531 RepID=UPI0036E2DB66
MTGESRWVNCHASENEFNFCLTVRSDVLFELADAFCALLHLADDRDKEHDGDDAVPLGSGETAAGGAQGVRTGRRMGAESTIVHGMDDDPMPGFPTSPRMGGLGFSAP